MVGAGPDASGGGAYGSRSASPSLPRLELVSSGTAGAATRGAYWTPSESSSSTGACEARLAYGLGRCSGAIGASGSALGRPLVRRRRAARPLAQAAAAWIAAGATLGIAPVTGAGGFDGLSTIGRVGAAYGLGAGYSCSTAALLRRRSGHAVRLQRPLRRLRPSRCGAASTTAGASCRTFLTEPSGHTPMWSFSSSSRTRSLRPSEVR